ncbi:MAG TPA: sigma-70 family RNA polymerase sigma factor [Candidatus Alectryocaccobium stercorigallinarum]|jgi:RNA polymerase sporulation-specific sigma factor|nr:sigma-70 family RNA polymerase sigma factor [Candidatus Alectryocaccobium stercorigallinarum]
MHADLKKYTDNELIEMFRAGDAAVGDHLVEKYKGLVKKKARLYYLEGGDHEDLLQEGMLGLFKAMSEYDPKKEASFLTFAGLCINRQMLSAIEAAGRKKHRALNESVPLEEVGDSASENGISAALDPEAIFMEQETEQELIKRIKENLSPMEYGVLELYLDGLDYRQIAAEMGKSEKSIDNALQRIRGKLKKMR